MILFGMPPGPEGPQLWVPRVVDERAQLQPHLFGREPMEAQSGRFHYLLALLDPFRSMNLANVLRTERAEIV